MRSKIETVLAWAAVLIIWVSPRGISGFDGSIRLNALEMLYQNNSLSPMKYSFVGPLFAYPLLALGHLLHNSHFFIISYNAILVSILYLVLYRFTQSSKLIIALGLFSILPLSTSNFDAEPFSALMVCSGLILWTQRKFALGSLLLALGAANTPALLVPTGVVSLFYFLRIKKTFLVFLAPALGLLCMMTENLIKFGNVSGIYFQSVEKGVANILPFSGLSGFSYPFILGLFAILFSFGKGLLFFMPGSFLANTDLTLPSKNKSVVEFTRLLMIYFLAMILVYAKWWSWYGGFSWGPRFFGLGSVLSSLYLAFARVNLVFLVVLFLQGWAAFLSLAMNSDAMKSCLGLGREFEYLCWYSPEYSPLFLPLWKKWPDISTRNWIHGTILLFLFIYFLNHTLQSKRRSS